MIELGLVHRMIRAGIVVALPLAAGLWAWGGGEAALSGVVGLGLALCNLWIAGRVIGGVADTNPGLLLVAALIAFGVGLGLLTAVALALQAVGVVSFPIVGLTLVGTHLALVLLEAGRAFPVGSGERADATGRTRDGVLKAGS